MEFGDRALCIHTFIFLLDQVLRHCAPAFRNSHWHKVHCQNSLRSLCHVCLILTSPTISPTQHSDWTKTPTFTHSPRQDIIMSSTSLSPDRLHGSRCAKSIILHGLYIAQWMYPYGSLFITCQFMLVNYSNQSLHHSLLKHYETCNLFLLPVSL